MKSLDVLELFAEETDPHRADRVRFDIVCAGDSLTGWGNFGPPAAWPYRCYPEFLQSLCEPFGLTVANCGLGGEVSENGISQVRDYLQLFSKARYFVIGFGSNDLDESSNVKAVSKHIVENLAKMTRAVKDRGKHAILLNAPDVNARLFPADMLAEAREKRQYLNRRLKEFCESASVPMADIAACLGQEHFADPCHPNVEGARVVAEEIFKVLSAIIDKAQ